MEQEHRRFLQPDFIVHLVVKRWKFSHVVIKKVQSRNDRPDLELYQKRIFYS